MSCCTCGHDPHRLVCATVLGMSRTVWRHPLDPETPPLVQPAARDPHATRALRTVLCRRCGHDCGVPGAVLCASCWPLVDSATRLLLTSGHDPIDPTVEVTP